MFEMEDGTKHAWELPDIVEIDDITDYYLMDLVEPDEVH